MIEVRRVFNAAKNIVLSQLPISTNDEVILQAIDLGVIELYKRFNLAINVETFETSCSQYVYELKNTDITKVILLQNESGKELIEENTINNEYFDYRPITYRKFLFRQPKNELITAIYKASSEEITNIDQTIDISSDFLGCLLDYVAYRCHITLNNDNLNEVDTHYKRFEISVQDLINQGYKQELTFGWK